MDCLIVYTNLWPYQAFFIFVSNRLLEFRTDSDHAMVINDSKMLHMWDLKMEEDNLSDVGLMVFSGKK